MRQSADDTFRELLVHLRNSKSSQDDYQLLCGRFIAVPLFPVKRLVEEHSSLMLRSLGRPIAVIKGVHNNLEARRADSNTAGGLESYVSLAVGVRIMLRSNLWIGAGLVNGNLGQVLDIVYLPGQSPPALPHFILCTFPQYTGPPFISNSPHSVPIVPIRRVWDTSNSSFSRTQLPLCLAYPITIHKCQGLNLNQAVVDLGTRDQSAGLSIVAISRVRRLVDLVLQPFAFDRISRLGSRSQA